MDMLSEIFLLVLFAFSLCVSRTTATPQHPLTIKADPSGTLVKGITESLTVGCYIEDVSAQGYDIVDIVLNSVSSGGQRDKLASMTMFHPDHPNLDTPDDAQVTGNISIGENSFLQVQWDLSFSSDISYMSNFECEVTVISQDAEEFLLQDFLTVYSRNPTTSEIASIFQREIEALKIDQADILLQNEQLRIDLKNHREEAVAETEQLKLEIEALKDNQNQTKMENEELLKALKSQVFQLADSGTLHLFYHAENVTEDGKRFHISKNAFVNIDRAEALCQLIKGHLAVFNNREELLEAKRFATSVGLHRDERIVLGITDESTEGLWVSVATGEPIVTHLWGSSANIGEEDSSTLNCANFSPSVQFPHYYPTECSKPESPELFICETTEF